MSLKSLRTAAGLTRAQLAERSGVNARQIQRVENGESAAGNMTLRNALALADALHTDVRELLDDAPPF